MSMETVASRRTSSAASGERADKNVSVHEYHSWTGAKSPVRFASESASEMARTAPRNRSGSRAAIAAASSGWVYSVHTHRVVRQAESSNPASLASAISRRKRTRARPRLLRCVGGEVPT